MKDLITSMASIAILLAFVLQFTQSQVTYNHMVSVDQAVNAFKEVVKQEGCVTEENKDKLRSNICRYTGCSSGEVRITGSSRPADRGEMIHYRVAVPVKGVIGAAGFWGISQAENRFTYVIDRYTTSEYLGSGG
jgi:hypothetical protein